MSRSIIAVCMLMEIWGLRKCSSSVRWFKVLDGIWKPDAVGSKALPSSLIGPLRTLSAQFLYHVSQKYNADSKVCRWTPYIFLEDSRLNHTGSNVFNMWKTESKGWIITGVADIAREVDENAFDAFGEAEKWEKSQRPQ